MIVNGTAIAVSDGSHAPGYSTSGFTLTRRLKKGPSFSNVRGSNVVPGNPEEQDSYRAELGGVMGIVVATHLICTLHNITDGSLEIGLDGEGAYKMLFERDDTPVDSKAFDLITTIKRLMQKSPIVYTGRHIQGHQDKHKSRHELTRWEALNVAMDSKAKRRLHKAMQAGAPNQRTPQWGKIGGHLSGHQTVQHLQEDSLSGDLWQGDQEMVG